eukprot:783463-Ditylum_brightwellii.AAC.1
MDDLSKAIESARYNDAVIVNVSPHSEGQDDKNQKEIILVASLDEVNGGIVWNDVHATTASAMKNGKEEDLGLLRHLRTKQWVLPMLHDEWRNKLYDEAIREAVVAVAKRKKKNDGEHDDRGQESIRVLDIGSGTG